VSPLPGKALQGSAEKDKYSHYALKKNEKINNEWKQYIKKEFFLSCSKLTLIKIAEL
jgi:hypothetical protein